jgi:sporulation protein YlmC with PRC-barrel domain
MRPHFKTLAFAAAMLPAIALAQTAPSTTAPQAPSAMPQATVPAPAQGSTAGVLQTTNPQARRASRVIGANIINEANNTVGEVHDLMISPTGGPVIAVLSVGGFLGIGERYVAVPLSDLRWNADRERWTLPGATVDSLKARPAYTYPERG